MTRALYALASLALGLLIVYGCAPGGKESLAAQIRVLEAEVREWTNPEDGKVYLGVAPTWKNEGPEPVRSVTLVAELEGPRGSFSPTGHDALPGGAQPAVLYSGDPVDAGTTVRPNDDVSSFAILGLREEVLQKTGPDPKAKVTVLWASSEVSETDGSQEPPAKP